jgi:hypothetical protein
MITDQEKKVVDHLVDAWNAFLKLPEGHGEDVAYFRTAINQAQLIIAGRVGIRVDPEYWIG